LCATTAVQPSSVLAPGFWLSYLAVGVLVYLVQAVAQTSPHPDAALDAPASVMVSRLRAAWLAVRSAALTQLELSIALLLPGVLFYGQVAWLAPVVNLFAIPYFALLVMPVTLLGTAVTVAIAPAAGAHFLQLAAALLGWLLLLLQGAASLPWAAWVPGGLGAVGWSVATVGALLVLVRTPVRRPCWGAALLLAGLGAPSFSLHDELRVLVLDVGQGTAVLVTRGTRAVLLDTGPAWRGGDAGATTVLPVLRHKGIRKLDLVAVSHADADHMGGLATLLQNIRVERLVVPHEMAIAYPQATVCRRGQRWMWAGVEITVQHPRNAVGLSRNDSSCVLRLRFGETTLWFPGDVEATGEALLVARTRPEAAALVVVPHHGSRTSSSAGYVELVQPQYAVVTNGFMNRWGFPNGPVVARWAGSGSCVIATADQGALEFAVGKAGRVTLLRRYASAWVRPWVVRVGQEPRCNTIKAGSRGV
jgi:competence protein ComEC